MRVRIFSAPHSSAENMNYDLSLFCDEVSVNDIKTYASDEYVTVIIYYDRPDSKEE